MSKQKNLDEQIREHHLMAHDLSSRAVAIDKEIENLEAQILSAETEEAIESVFEKIEALRVERRQKLLLGRRQSILRLKRTEEKIENELETEKDTWSDLIDQLPYLLENVENAQLVLDGKKDLAFKSESKIRDLERQLEQTQINRVSVENQKTFEV